MPNWKRYVPRFRRQKQLRFPNGIPRAIVPSGQMGGFQVNGSPMIPWNASAAEVMDILRYGGMHKLVGVFWIAQAQHEEEYYAPSILGRGPQAPAYITEWPWNRTRGFVPEARVA